MTRCKKPSYSLHPKLVFKWCQWCKLLWCLFVQSHIYCGPWVLLQGRVPGPQEERFRVDFGEPTGVKAPWISWRLGDLWSFQQSGSIWKRENPMCLGVYPKGFVYILITLAVPKFSSFRPISSVSAGRLWSPATWRLSIWKLRKERWWLPSPER